MSSETRDSQGRLMLFGRVSGALGLKGEVKLESFSDPRHAIFRYQPWTLQRSDKSPPSLAQVDTDFARALLSPQQTVTVSGVKGRETGKHIVAKFPGVDDRNAAEAIYGLDIYVSRSQLPPPAADEFYWVDLEGMRVLTTDGVDLGTVSYLFATGANDVVVVRDDTRERLIPFVRPQYITDIDFDAGQITVDWDPEF